jgi:hypothetical protein
LRRWAGRLAASAAWRCGRRWLAPTLGRTTSRRARRGRGRAAGARPSQCGEGGSTFGTRRTRRRRGRPHWRGRRRGTRRHGRRRAGRAAARVGGGGRGRKTDRT